MKNLLVGFLAGVVIGGAGIGIYSHHVTEHELASVIFGKELFAAQAASRNLRLIDEERFDTLRKVMHTELDSSIDSSYRLMVSHKPDLGILAPNLIRGLAGAEEYLEVGDQQGRSLLWLRDIMEYVERASKEYERRAG